MYSPLCTHNELYIHGFKVYLHVFSFLVKGLLSLDFLPIHIYVCICVRYTRLVFNHLLLTTLKHGVKYLSNSFNENKVLSALNVFWECQSITFDRFQCQICGINLRSNSVKMSESCCP